MTKTWAEERLGVECCYWSPGGQVDVPRQLLSFRLDVHEEEGVHPALLVVLVPRHQGEGLAAAAGCSPLLDGAHHEGVPRAGPQQVPRLLSVLVDLLQPLDL